MAYGKCLMPEWKGADSGCQRAGFGRSSRAGNGEPPGTRTEPGLFREAYCDSRCSCPARLFSLGLLDGPQGTPASPSLSSSPGGLRPHLSRDGLPDYSGLWPSP